MFHRSMTRSLNSNQPWVLVGFAFCRCSFDPSVNIYRLINCFIQNAAILRTPVIWPLPANPRQARRDQRGDEPTCSKNARLGTSPQYKLTISGRDERPPVIETHRGKGLINSHF